MRKVTKKNYKNIIKELKANNTKIYSVSGKRISARNARFKLRWNVKGNWELLAYVK